MISGDFVGFLAGPARTYLCNISPDEVAVTLPLHSSDIALYMTYNMPGHMTDVCHNILSARYELRAHASARKNVLDEVCQSTTDCSLSGLHFKTITTSRDRKKYEHTLPCPVHGEDAYNINKYVQHKSGISTH